MREGGLFDGSKVSVLQDEKVLEICYNNVHIINTYCTASLKDIKMVNYEFGYNKKRVLWGLI